MKKKISIVLGGTGILFIILGVIFNITPDNKNLYIKNITIKDDEKFDICNTESCAVFQKTYSTINIDSNVTSLNQIVEKLNTKSIADMEQTKNSGTCQNTTNYKYKTKVNTRYYKSVSKDINSLSTYSYKIDLCTDKITEQKVDINNYSIKENKYLTQNEFISYLGITKKEIENQIKQNIEYQKNISLLGISDRLDSDKYYVTYNDNKITIIYYNYNFEYYNSFEYEKG